MQNIKEAKRLYYQRRRAEQIKTLHKEKKQEFLAKYPEWNILRILVKPNHVELIEKLHGLTPIYYTIQDIATEKGVSRQAIHYAHQLALKALDKQNSKL